MVLGSVVSDYQGGLWQLFQQCCVAHGKWFMDVPDLVGFTQLLL